MGNGSGGMKGRGWSVPSVHSAGQPGAGDRPGYANTPAGPHKGGLALDRGRRPGADPLGAVNSLNTPLPNASVQVDLLSSGLASHGGTRVV